MVRRSSGVPGRRAILLCVALAVTVACALPSVASAQGQGKRIMLYTGTTGFRHTDGINGGRPIDPDASSRRSATRSTGRTATNLGTGRPPTATTRTRTRAIFTAENLARYDAIVFLNMSWAFAGRQPAGPAAPAAAEGRASSATCRTAAASPRCTTRPTPAPASVTWDWWDGSSRTRSSARTMPGHAATNATGNFATVQVADRNHLSTKDLPDTWTIADEHYNYLRNVRGDHHVLATFDERTYTPGRQRQGPGSPDHVVQALRRHTARRRHPGTSRLPRRPHLDHRHGPLRRPLHGDTAATTTLVKMMVGGIRWVAGEGKKTDCSGTVWSSFRRTVLVADANQPIGIDVSKDGKVYWTEMGQIGTAAGQYNSTGAIMMHDQKGAPGQQDHGRHDPDPRGSRQLRGRRAGLHACSRASISRTRTSGTCSRTTRRVRVPGDNWPMSATPARAGRRLQPDQPLDGDRRRQVGRAGLRARDPARPEGEDRRLAVRLPPAAGQPNAPTDSGPGHVGGAGLDFDSGRQPVPGRR